MFRLDPSRSEPLFQQLVAAVRRDVATGRLRPGDRLPTVRELARELVLNPNTIAKAYRALEDEGLTASRRGAGTFVAEGRTDLSRAERKRRFRQTLDAALAEAATQGMTGPEARQVFEAALRRFRLAEEGTP